MNVQVLVNSLITNRKSKEWLVGELDPNLCAYNDLIHSLDGVFRSRWMTRDKERAIAFVVLQKLISGKSQLAEFPDPNNGMVRKKIKDIDLFVKEYSNSIYSFVKFIPEVM